MTNPFDLTIESAIKTLRESLASADWWELVQDEVKERLDFVVLHLDTIGVDFRDAFVAVFKYEHLRRVLEKEAVPRKRPGALFGKIMPEESYRSGIEPTKTLLSLQDWVQPHDADVQACMYVCQQVDIFETLGLFGSSKQRSSSISKAFKTFQGKSRKKRKFNPKVDLTELDDPEELEEEDFDIP